MAIALAGCPTPVVMMMDMPDAGDDAGVDAGVDAGTSLAPPPHHFVEVGAMHVGRISHTATLLESGDVLVVGGAALNHAPLASVELYSAQSREFTELAPLSVARANHTATMLPNGKVLIAGGGRANGSGYPGSDVTASCLLYDPQSKTFSATGDLQKARSHHVAVALKSGDVLAFGGGGGTFARGSPYMADTLEDAEVYSVSAGTWRTVGAMKLRRAFHAGALLGSGEVLVVGGTDEQGSSTTEAELYDPQAETWRVTGSLNTQDRFRHAITVLGDGTVLVAAGKKSNTAFLDTVERYDPGTGTFTTQPTLAKGGNSARLVTLPSGDAVFIGGYGAFTGPSAIYEALDLVQLFETRSGTWRQLGKLNLARTWHTATLLKSGQVLVTGGLIGVAETARSEQSEACTGAQCTRPDGITGTACVDGAACAGLGTGSSCREHTTTQSSYPGGLCTNDCASDLDCANDAVCVASLGSYGEAASICLPRCEASACRPTGYACYSLKAVSRVKACWLDPLPAVDGGASAPPGVIGKACSADPECQPPGRGSCLKGNGFNGGYCTAACDGLGDAYCGPGAKCAAFRGGQALCMASCTTAWAGQGECRTGYVCKGFSGSDAGTGGPGICHFNCNNDPHAACGNAPCKADGYCDL